MRKIFTLLIVAILATATSWAATTGTITFGTKNVKITKASMTAADDQGNSWKITTVGTTSFTQQPTYSQVGSDSKPATSITFTTTLPKEVKVTSMSAKFGGFGSTAGNIKLLVGDTEIGTGKLNAKNDVIVTSNTEASGTQLSVTVKNIAKGVKCYNISYTYEDESGKTPTQLSWSAPTATVDLTSEVKEFPTLTKDPASITGITYTSSNADVATVNEATGEITLVACGQTTIKAAYAGDDTYASSSATYTLRVVDNSIAAGEYTIPINNWFWATNYTGSFNVEKGSLKLQGQQNGISISLGNVNSTNAYVDDNETRTYRSYMMTVNAPEGYVLKKIEFVGTKWQSSTLNASAGNMGAQKIWSGNVSSVEFYFAETCEIKNVKIAYEKAAPAKTLTSIAITGEPAKVAYETGESFNPEGLTVTATYDDKSTADVTADATWTFNPAVFNTTGSVTVIALAAYGGKDGVAEYTVTVSAKPLKLTITPATGTYTSAQTVTIEANNAVGDVAIYYTTDGSDPADGANEYTAPFEVATTTTVKAYAIDDEFREATAESVITIKASTFAAENFSGCNTKGGRDNNFSEGSGTLSDDNFDCGGWVYDATVYAANSCVRVGTKSNNGSLTSPVVAGTNYNAISFDIAGWEDSKVNTLTVTINNGGAFADGTTSKSFTATNAKWTTVTEKITGLTHATTFTFSGKRLFLDSIILMNASTLAELAENGEEGKEYTVNDEMVVAKKFQAGNKNYIVVKDAAPAVRNLSAPTADDKSFNINGNKQEEYAQNNWMLVSLPVELYNQVNEENTVTSITGSLTEKFNVAMEATNVVFENSTTDFAPNTYCPINFMGESSVKGTNPAYTSSYYFATPKANEYANVVWAVYNGTDGAFYLPVHQGSANAQEFKAAFNVDYSLNSNVAPQLTDGAVYSFEALVKEVATTNAKSAPAYDATVTPSTKYVVYPLNLDADKVATGVNDVNSAKEVKGVSYFNMMGVESAQPFDGVNIMVTTYTDGTQSATKVLR